jgi:hypothetical protein
MKKVAQANKMVQPMKFTVVVLVGFGAVASFNAKAATVSQIHNAPGWLLNHAYTAGQVNSGLGWDAKKFSLVAGSSSLVKISARSITPSVGGGVTNLLQMPSGITGNQTVDVGSGPHVITLTLAGSSGQPANQFYVSVSDGTNTVQVTDNVNNPMIVTSNFPAYQTFKLRGDWGINVKQVIITGVGSAGLNALNLGDQTAGIFYDSQAFAYLGPAFGASNTPPQYSPSQGYILYTVPNQPEAWTPCNTFSWIDCPPTYTASPSIISGATVNSVAQSPGTLDNIANQGSANNYVPGQPNMVARLPAGHFTGTSRIWIPGDEVYGAGMGKTIIDGRNLSPFQGKAIFDLETHAIKLANMTITGAQIGGSEASGNGANAGCVFMAEGGTFDHVEFTMCQNGLRGQSIDASSPVTVSNSYFHDNGSRTGFTHEIYIAGGPLAAFTNDTVVSGDRSTHALKSRAAHTVVNRGSYSGCTDPTHQPCGSVMDFPDGGDVDITGTTIIVTPNAILSNGSSIAIGYGMEDARNGVTRMNLTDLVIDNRAPTAPRIITNKPGATLNLSGCTYKGSFPVSVEGWTTVNGSCTPFRR